jgi:hypothetical protein
MVQKGCDRTDYQAIEFIARYNGTYEVEYKTKEGRRRTLWIKAVSGTEQEEHGLLRASCLLRGTSGKQREGMAAQPPRQRAAQSVR